MEKGMGILCIAIRYSVVSKSTYVLCRLPLEATQQSVLLCKIEDQHIIRDMTLPHERDTLLCLPRIRRDFYF